VERAKDRLRVTAQLLDVENGRQLQSFAVDQPIANIMDLQNDIGGRVAKDVSTQLTGVDLPPQGRSRSTSVDAYLKFLDAQALLDRQTTEASEQAALILGQVTKMDPTFAIGYAELARARWSALENDSKEERASLLPLVEKALMLDPTLGEAYSIRGVLESDHKAAETDFRKGIELAPNYAPGYELYADSLRQELDEGLDMMDRALDMMDRAVPIDPLTAHYIVQKAAYLYFNMHQSAAGEKLFLQAAALEPDLAGVNMSLAYIE
jgi:adenylate cyclase